MNKFQGLSCFALVMLVTGAIDSVRNLPTAALFGSNLIFFFTMAAIFFLLPSSLVSSELSSTYTKEGGIYGWIKLAFGEEVAFLAIWLQWVNTLVWYPTMLSFIVGTAAFLINPSLIQNKLYLISSILTIFWIMTWMNLKGLETSARFASVCTILGMLLPMVLIIGLGMFWLLTGHASQIHFAFSNLMPDLHVPTNWASLTAIMTAFLGIELATVHAQQVCEPQKTLPKAMLISTFIILVTMCFGSLAIAIVLPPTDIHLVDGVMQAMARFFEVYHLHAFVPVVSFLVVLGCLGSMVNWMISPARGLYLAARQGYFPKRFSRVNKHGVAQPILIMQAILVSFICLVFLTTPSINAAYWLLTDLSTQLYMLMYVLMFIAALRLRIKNPNIERPFSVPGGKIGLWVCCLAGLFGCIVTLVIGFFPPAEIDMGNHAHYELVFGGSLFCIIVPVLFFYMYSVNQSIKEDIKSAPSYFN